MSSSVLMPPSWVLLDQCNNTEELCGRKRTQCNWTDVGAFRNLQHSCKSREKCCANSC